MDILTNFAPLLISHKTIEKHFGGPFLNFDALAIFLCQKKSWFHDLSIFEFSCQNIDFGSE